jgi:orotate phosphoribosyltransferase
MLVENTGTIGDAHGDVDASASAISPGVSDSEPAREAAVLGMSSRTGVAAERRSAAWPTVCPMSTPTPSRDALATRVFGCAALTGEFRLRSGAVSSTYFDKYQFESDPVLLREIAQALVELLPRDIDLLAGLELGGVPLATVASQLTGLPAVFVRKHAKDYGTCRLAEGADITDRRLAVIEDVVTSGGQLITSCRELQNRRATIAAVLCVIDRQAGGAANLGAHGLELRSLFTLDQLEIRKPLKPRCATPHVRRRQQPSDGYRDAPDAPRRAVIRPSFYTTSVAGQFRESGLASLLTPVGQVVTALAETEPAGREGVALADHGVRRHGDGPSAPQRAIAPNRAPSVIPRHHDREQTRGRALTIPGSPRIKPSHSDSAVRDHSRRCDLAQHTQRPRQRGQPDTRGGRASDRRRPTVHEPALDGERSLAGAERTDA